MTPRGFHELYARGLAATKTPDHHERPARFYNLVQLYRLAPPGPTVEIGCWLGLSSFLLLSSSPSKHHTVIDSFKGLRPTAEDGPAAEAAGRFSGSSKAHVERVLREITRDVDVIEGTVPEVLDTLPESAYAFVHVDVDLYVPTLACLRYFHPRLLPGGLLVVDDFGPWEHSATHYPGCERAIEEFRADSGVQYAALTTGNAILLSNPR